MSDTKEQIKQLLRRLHEEEDTEALRDQFKDLLRSVSPEEIPAIEQELMREGMSPEELAGMCDLHVELFREAVAEEHDIEVPAGHPLHTLYRENEHIAADAEKLSLYARSKDTASLQSLARQLPAIGYTHYMREQMLLFPYLERRGITAVPSTLWRKQDEARDQVKTFLQTLKTNGSEAIADMAAETSRMLIEMTFRENNILYPTLHELLSRGEWKAIRQQEAQLGYYRVEPPAWEPDVEPVHPYQLTAGIEEASELPDEIQTIVEQQGAEPDRHHLVRDDDLDLTTGFLSQNEIDNLLGVLPVGITYIDRDDRVRFFSGADRVFKRTPSVLGRPVQHCHPPSSVHMVNNILKTFKQGDKDVASFWIQLGDRFIHIRYFAVRDSDGTYLGTVEVEQDVTDIRQLEGERRLPDWDR
jgi:hypothetical protein